MKNSMFLRLCIVMATLASVAAFGCTEATKPAGNVTDDLGRQVAVSSIPQRIVSLAPSTTEILFDLGLGNKVVGVDSYSDYPEPAKTKPKVGGFSDTDVEKVVSLRPDLVVAASIHKDKVIPALEKAGLTVVGLDATDLEGVIKDVRMVGKLTGTTGKAESLAKSLEDRMKIVTSKTAALPDSKRPRVFIAVWQNPLWSAGSGTMEADLVVKAGGINVTADLTGYQTASLEKVVAADPQAILAFGGTAMGGTVDWAKAEPRLASSSARKANPPRIYEATDLYKRPSPRAFDALEELARNLHPDLF